MALASADYAQIVSRITDLERQRDRNAAARILSGPIGNADVDPAAGIVVSKLYGGGTANRLVRTTDGTNMVMGQLVAADVTANTLTAAQMAAQAIHTQHTFQGHSGTPVVATGGQQTVPGSTLGLTTGTTTHATFCSAMTRLTCSVNGTVMTVYLAINGSLQLEIGTFSMQAPNWHYTFSVAALNTASPNTLYNYSLIFVANAGTISFGNGWTSVQEWKR